MQIAVIDRAEIYVRGGNGGNGVISFRREKFVPRGGPDGGDGGQGGNVVLVADPEITTLQDLRYKSRYLAEHGGNGARQKMHGASGKDLFIRVPVGTQVRRLDPPAYPGSGGGNGARHQDSVMTAGSWESDSDGDEPDDDVDMAANETDQDGDAGDAASIVTPSAPETPGELVADLAVSGARFTAAYGGMGGKGNARFTTPTNQAPRIAERGQRGGEGQYLLDLKLISDVGIIGVPSVGKSTLIAAVSAARPKIAAYPFTTLEPNLGVVSVGYDTFVMADIPGLIEGAHAGVGLGHDFLRHVERTRLLVHLIDGSAEDPISEMDTVNRELALFSPELAAKPQIVAINKIDVPEAEARLPELTAVLRSRGITPLAISAAAAIGVDELVRHVFAELTRLKREQPAPLPPPEQEPVIRPAMRPRVTVERDDKGVFHVHGRRVEAMAEMLDLKQEEARAEFYRRLNRLGVTTILRRAGAIPGSRVRFGTVEIKWDA